MDFYPPSYHKNPLLYKSKKISSWKEQGIIHNDYNTLYQLWIDTMKCNHCDKDFKNARDKHTDHDHKTGLFRKILCCACNVKDCHLRHPPSFTSIDKHRKADLDSYYRHRDKRLEDIKQRYHKNKVLKNPNDYTTQRVNCFFCNKNISKANLTRHFKSSVCPMIKPN